MKKITRLFIALTLTVLCISGCNNANNIKTDNSKSSSSTADEVIEPTETLNNSDATQENSTGDTNKPIGGSSTSCEIHDPSFHRIPGPLIDYVGGQEVYDTWSGNATYTDNQECPRADKSIYTFIHDFDVPKTYFEELYYSQLYATIVCDVDLLYGDDYSSVDEFYRDKEMHDTILSKRSNLNGIKIRILTNNYENFTDAFGDASPISLSLTEIVNRLNIPREKLKEYASGFVAETYDINFDAIYGASSSVQINTNNGPDPYPVRASDALVCGIDDYELE